MNRGLLNRVRALESRFVPPDPWILTVEYADGHTAQMSASEYKAVKAERLQDVHVTDRIITGNVAELESWLATVRFVAESMKDQDCRSITSYEEWEKTGTSEAVTAI